MKIVFAGTFAARLAPRVSDSLSRPCDVNDRLSRSCDVDDSLSTPCDVVVCEESALVSELGDADVLVTMGFTRTMGEAAKRLRLVQVPGAGLDRIDRNAVPSGVALANAYGHEVGIAEWVLAALLMLTRELGRLDAALRRGVWKSSGPWALSRLRHGRSWPGRPSSSSGMDGSASALRAGRGRSTCPSWRSVARRSSTGSLPSCRLRHSMMS